MKIYDLPDDTIEFLRKSVAPCLSDFDEDKDINESFTDHQGNNTYLLITAISNNLDLNIKHIKVLLKYGANPNQLDFRNCTAGVYAIVADASKCLRSLIHYNADLTLKHGDDERTLFDAYIQLNLKRELKEIGMKVLQGLPIQQEVNVMMVGLFKGEQPKVFRELMMGMYLKAQGPLNSQEKQVCKALNIHFLQIKDLSKLIVEYTRPHPYDFLNWMKLDIEDIWDLFLRNGRKFYQEEQNAIRREKRIKKVDVLEAEIRHLTRIASIQQKQISELQKLLINQSSHPSKDDEKSKPALTFSGSLEKKPKDKQKKAAIKAHKKKPL